MKWVEIKSKDGTKLAGFLIVFFSIRCCNNKRWIMKQEESKNSPTVVLFHKNAGSFQKH